MAIKVAVIGTGNMGRHHARVYSNIKDAELVGVADINEKQGKEIARENCCKYYKNYKDLISNESPNAISICVPTSLHSKIATETLKSKIHTLVEKPIASTLEEAQKLVYLAKENNVKLMVGHIERFNPAVQKLKEIVKKGSLGDITSILARRVGLFPPQIKDTNVVIDLAVHDIDIFNYILEKDPTEIFSSSGKAIHDTKEDYSDIFLKYGQTNCVIEVNWITPVKIRTLSVTGTGGYAELNYITQDLTVYGTQYEKTHNSFGEFVLKFGTPKKQDIDVKKAEPLNVELEHFINCIKQNKNPLSTGEDAIKALSIALRIVNCRNNCCKT